MLRSANDATPLASGTTTVPLNVPPPGLVPMATVTLDVLSVVTTLPPASSSDTLTAGLIEVPATVLLGCTVKSSLLGVPTVTLNASLTAAVSVGVEVASSVYPVPARLMLRPLNDATPPD